MLKQSTLGCSLNTKENEYFLASLFVSLLVIIFSMFVILDLCKLPLLATNVKFCSSWQHTLSATQTTGPALKALFLP